MTIKGCFLVSILIGKQVSVECVRRVDQTDRKLECAVDYDTTALSAIRDVGSLWWRPLAIYF